MRTEGFSCGTGGQGFEPQPSDPESPVLPIILSPIGKMKYSRRCGFEQVLRPGQTLGTGNEGRDGTKKVGVESGFPFGGIALRARA